MAANEVETRVRWSSWSRCGSSFDLLLVPDSPGVYVLAEEMVPPGGSSALGERRMLAVLEVAVADGLARTLGRLFIQPTVRDRLLEGRCFMRYAVIHDSGQRAQVCAALQRYLTGAADTAATYGADADATAASIAAAF